MAQGLPLKSQPKPNQIQENLGSQIKNKNQKTNPQFSGTELKNGLWENPGGNTVQSLPRPPKPRMRETRWSEYSSETKA